MTPEGRPLSRTTPGKRLTVGVLLGFDFYEGSYPNPFSHPVIRGIQAAAHDGGVNLMVGCGLNRGIGSRRRRPAWPEPDPDVDFVPIGPWNTDGLLIITPLYSENHGLYARHLIDQGFPLLFIGNGSGTPNIMVDNEMGIRQMLEHLIGHGHRRIAFIAGEDQDSGDSWARLEAYTKGVQEFGLVSDPRMIEYGQHWEIGGYNAMHRMLKSGVEFNAVICSNDQSAIGVMRALREEGVRIPWDVVVTGFDDVPEGLAQVPPLTSIHFPLFETGYRALLLLQKRMESGPDAIPDTIRVSTWLVARQSCGCLPELVAKAVEGTSLQSDPTASSPPEIKESIVQAMLEALFAESNAGVANELRPHCDRLVDGFLQSLEDGDISHFQTALIDILQQVEVMHDDDAHIWQAAITVLRKGARTILQSDKHPRRLDRTEDMLHQARALLSESAKRRNNRREMQQSTRDETMGRLTSRLISSLDKNQVYAALREGLPLVGINSCKIAYFEPQAGDPVAFSRLHRLEGEEPDIRFETRTFPPSGLYPSETSFSLVLLPFFFQDADLGYVAFEGTSLMPLATIVQQLSAALHSAELHDQVLELSLTDGLTGVHNRRYFDLMLEKETGRSQRYNRDLAVIMADIDLFKLYNDAHGHPAGDKALQEVAECITRGARRGLDVVTRYGGEEFAIILPETDVEGARIVAEKIRQEMAASAQFLQPTTLSLGIASLRGNQLRSQTLVEEADRALYQAKNQGRDRVVIFEEWMQDTTQQMEKKG